MDEHVVDDKKGSDAKEAEERQSRLNEGTRMMNKHIVDVDKVVIGCDGAKAGGNKEMVEQTIRNEAKQVEKSEATVNNSKSKQPTINKCNNTNQMMYNNSRYDHQSNQMTDTDLQKDNNNQLIYSPNRRYRRLNTILGQGTFKTVYRAIDEEEGKEVAWNVVTNDYYMINDHKNDDINKDTDCLSNTEIDVLTKIKHENIISLLDHFYDNGVIFITELMTSGTLRDYLKTFQRPNINLIRKWGKQILEGIEYLHSVGIIHRDIKTDNIFVNGATGVLKIGDLGIARKRQKNFTVVGTPEYMAIEILEGDGYTSKVDIYAYGMVLLELATGKIPYSECPSAAAVFKRVISNELPMCVELVENKCLRFFILSLLAEENLRPTASEALNHHFFKGDCNGCHKPESVEFCKIKVEEKLKFYVYSDNTYTFECDFVIVDSNEKKDGSISTNSNIDSEVEKLINDGKDKPSTANVDNSKLMEYIRRNIKSSDEDLKKIESFLVERGIQCLVENTDRIEIYEINDRTIADIRKDCENACICIHVNYTMSDKCFGVAVEGSWSDLVRNIKKNDGVESVLKEEIVAGNEIEEKKEDIVTDETLEKLEFLKDTAEISEQMKNKMEEIDKYIDKLKAIGEIKNNDSSIFNTTFISFENVNHSVIDSSTDILINNTQANANNTINESLIRKSQIGGLIYTPNDSEREISTALETAQNNKLSHNGEKVADILNKSADNNKTGISISTSNQLKIKSSAEDNKASEQTEKKEDSADANKADITPNKNSSKKLEELYADDNLSYEIEKNRRSSVYKEVVKMMEQPPQPLNKMEKDALIRECLANLESILESEKKKSEVAENKKDNRFYIRNDFVFNGKPCSVDIKHTMADGDMHIGYSRSKIVEKVDTNVESKTDDESRAELFEDCKDFMYGTKKIKKIRGIRVGKRLGIMGQEDENDVEIVNEDIEEFGIDGKNVEAVVSDSKQQQADKNIKQKEFNKAGECKKVENKGFVLSRESSEAFNNSFTDKIESNELVAMMIRPKIEEEAVLLDMKDIINPNSKAQSKIVGKCVFKNEKEDFNIDKYNASIKSGWCSELKETSIDNVIEYSDRINSKMANEIEKQEELICDKSSFVDEYKESNYIIMELPVGVEGVKFGGAEIKESNLIENKSNDVADDSKILVEINDNKNEEINKSIENQNKKEEAAIDNYITEKIDNLSTNPSNSSFVLPEQYCSRGEIKTEEVVKKDLSLKNNNFKTAEVFIDTISKEMGKIENGNVLEEDNTINRQIKNLEETNDKNEFSKNQTIEAKNNENSQRTKEDEKVTNITKKETTNENIIEDEKKQRIIDFNKQYQPDSKQVTHLCTEIADNCFRSEEVLESWLSALRDAEIDTVGELRMLTLEDWDNLDLPLFCSRSLKNSVCGKTSPISETKLKTIQTMIDYNESMKIEDFLKDVFKYKAGFNLENTRELFNKQDLWNLSELRMLRDEDWDRIGLSVLVKRIIKNTVNRRGQC